MPRISLKKIDIIVSLLVIPVCLYVFYESARWPVIDGTGNATWVPRGDAVFLLAAAIAAARQSDTRPLAYDPEPARGGGPQPGPLGRGTDGRLHRHRGIRGLYCHGHSLHVRFRFCSGRAAVGAPDPLRGRGSRWNLYPFQDSPPSAASGRLVHLADRKNIKE